MSRPPGPDKGHPRLAGQVLTNPATISACIWGEQPVDPRDIRASAKVPELVGAEDLERRGGGLRYRRGDRQRRLWVGAAGT